VELVTHGTATRPACFAAKNHGERASSGGPALSSPMLMRDDASKRRAIAAGSPHTRAFFILVHAIAIVSDYRQQDKRLVSFFPSAVLHLDA